ncbi:MAG TPA: MMPL family transporter [Chloroflexota bacterium]|nr:MMPL family transporter [Chloroflexota bacterium]
MSPSSFLAAFGSLCWRRSKTVILLWVVATLIGGSVAGKLSGRLLSGSGDIAGSASLRVDAALGSNFPNTGGQSLILTFRSPGWEQDPAHLGALVSQLKSRLSALPAVASTTSEDEMPNALLRAKGGSGHLMLIELTTNELLATEEEVPKIRAELSAVFEDAQAQEGSVEWAITGRAALTHDINRFNDEDAARSEIRALPFTLAILIFAFGSLAAAILPLVLALVTRTVALGIVFLVAGSVETSNLVLSVVTMLALALSIDYSLFLIHRFRREHARIGASHAGGAIGSAEPAMRAAMAESGAAVLYSAVTVGIGMGALLVTPLMQTRSIGVGGLIAVLIALLTSLTLVPAFLRLLGPRILEWPGWLSRPLMGERSHRMWLRWADVILHRPVLAILASLAILLAMAAPALSTRFGFPEGQFLPPQLEYSRGTAMLGDMGLKGLVAPVEVLVSDTNGGRALDPERVPLLADFVARLEQDRRVSVVLGPVRSSADMSAPSGSQGAASISEAMSEAFFRRTFIRTDGTRLLFRIIPAGDSTLDELRELSNDIPEWLQVQGLVAEVGGQAQYYDDVETTVGESYPLTIGLVLGVSAVALLLFFGAPLASAKAIFLNLLSVGAGYGVVVLVFQLGHGAELFGLSGGTGMVPITVPLLIFCILFGLSMDYEIFLLTRVRKLFEETGDTARSVKEALADTGSVITSAALVMVAVFGAFAFARMVIVQMIGLGLAVAVLVDATVIRSVLGPALMQIADRWNWWPLQRGPRFHPND